MSVWLLCACCAPCHLPIMPARLGLPACLPVRPCPTAARPCLPLPLLSGGFGCGCGWDPPACHSLRWISGGFYGYMRTVLASYRHCGDPGPRNGLRDTHTALAYLHPLPTCPHHLHPGASITYHCETIFMNLSSSSCSLIRLRSFSQYLHATTLSLRLN